MSRGIRKDDTARLASPVGERDTGRSHGDLPSLPAAAEAGGRSQMARTAEPGKQQAQPLKENPCLKSSMYFGQAPAFNCHRPLGGITLPRLISNTPARSGVKKPSADDQWATLIARKSDYFGDPFEAPSGESSGSNT